jgi:hypothetical protein
MVVKTCHVINGVTKEEAGALQIKLAIIQMIVIQVLIVYDKIQI